MIKWIFLAFLFVKSTGYLSLFYYVDLSFLLLLSYVLNIATAVSSTGLVTSEDLDSPVKRLIAHLFDNNYDSSIRPRRDIGKPVEIYIDVKRYNIESLVRKFLLLST